MANKGFFVTATDTGVGKTVVSAALLRLLRRHGLNVCGMKPVESGCRRQGDEGLVPADGVFLLEASGADEPLRNIAPYRFAEPLAPWVAAERQGVEIDAEIIVEKFNDISSRYDAVVAEGIGGLMVPIAEDYFVSDMARDFGLPLIIVASPALGTINHTLLSVEHALRKGLGVAGIVINYSSPPSGTVSEETNPDSVGRLSPVPVIGMMPFLRETTPEAIEGAAGNLDWPALRSALFD